MVERLSNGDDANSHRSSLFKGLTVWNLGQVTIFDHGEVRESTMFKLLLDTLGFSTATEDDVTK